jgi:hypothetical protein
MMLPAGDAPALDGWRQRVISWGPFTPDTKMAPRSAAQFRLAMRPAFHSMRVLHLGDSRRKRMGSGWLRCSILIDISCVRPTSAHEH